MPKLEFLVTVDATHVSGKFASKDAIADEIRDQLEDVDISSVDEAEYEADVTVEDHDSASSADKVKKGRLAYIALVELLVLVEKMPAHITKLLQPVLKRARKAVDKAK